MPDRSWFYADRGQQQRPFPGAQFRELIASGRVRPDTLVWTEGMAGWQKAGEIPGLLSPAARPLAIPLPWVLRWIMRWHASQFVLVERGA